MSLPVSSHLALDNMPVILLVLRPECPSRAPLGDAWPACGVTLVREWKRPSSGTYTIRPKLPLTAVVIVPLTPLVMPCLDIRDCEPYDLLIRRRYGRSDGRHTTIKPILPSSRNQRPSRMVNSLDPFFLSVFRCRTC